MAKGTKGLARPEAGRNGKGAEQARRLAAVFTPLIQLSDLANDLGFTPIQMAKLMKSAMIGAKNRERDRKRLGLLPLFCDAMRKV